MAVDQLVSQIKLFSAAEWRRREWGGGNAWASLVSAHQYSKLCGLMNRYVPDRGRVLDWGSAGGQWSFALVSSGYRTSGFDLVEPPLVDELIAFGDGRYDFTAATDPVALPFADAEFDAVISVGVLEHVRETGGTEEASLAQIVRVLKPGGTFVCYHFPNRRSWIDAAARRMPGKHSHPFRYVRQDIERLAAASGLHLIECRRYGALPRNVTSRLPTWLSDTPTAAAIFDAADACFGVVARPFCQNYLWVGRRPADG